MADDNFWTDLTQFLDARLAQLEASLRNDIFTAIEGLKQNEIAVLRQEMLDGFAGVGEAIEQIHVQLHKAA